MKNIIVPFLFLGICTAILWGWTNGFQTFTVFSHTLYEAGTLPRKFPDVQMIDQDGQTFHIRDKHKYVLVNFVYLNCPNVCHKINNRLENIYDEIGSGVIPNQLELVTVSFDTRNDNIKKIKNYRNQFGDDIHGWTFALPYQISGQKFEKVLYDVGIWAKSAPGSNVINHSVYLFLVSPENKIVEVFDPAREDDQAIMGKLYSCIKG